MKDEKKAEKNVLIKCFDGETWAKEFIKVNKKRNIANDLDTMRGWFANAIMTGYDIGFEKGRKEKEE